MSKKIIIIGKFPPPVGGVTMHVERFFQKFETNSDDLKFYLFDTKVKRIITNSDKLSFIQSLTIFCKCNLVHIHISNKLKLVIALFARIFRKKVIYTHHNSIIHHPTFFSILSKICHKIILVNDKNINPKLINQSFACIPAFIEPQKVTPLDRGLVENLKRHDFVAVASCYKYVLINDKHVYGFDIAIQAFSKLMKRTKYKLPVLVLVDPSGTTQKFVASEKKKWEIEDNNLIFINDPLDFSELIKHADVVLRPTRTDGDALAVREALFYNKPVIASDVVWRPQGTMLFKNEDPNDLTEKILDIQNFSPPSQNRVDFGRQILDIYQYLLQEIKVKKFDKKKL